MWYVKKRLGRAQGSYLLFLQSTGEKQFCKRSSDAFKASQSQPDRKGNGRQKPRARGDVGEKLILPTLENAACIVKKTLSYPLEIMYNNTEKTAFLKGAARTITGGSL